MVFSSLTFFFFLKFQFIGKPEPTDSRHGLIFRAFLYLFQLLQERKDTNFVLKASFLEIYNEKVSGITFIRTLLLLNNCFPVDVISQSNSNSNSNAMGFRFFLENYSTNDEKKENQTKF